MWFLLQRQADLRESLPALKDYNLVREIRGAPNNKPQKGFTTYYTDSLLPCIPEESSSLFASKAMSDINRLSSSESYMLF